MAIYKRDVVDINLETGNIHRSFLKHSIGTGDNQADQFGIRTFRDGVPVDLTGVSCQGVFRDPQGNNIALTSHGTVIGNVAYLTLPQACYNYEGQFTLSIKLVGGGVTGTMRIVDGVVDNTHTGGTVAPTSAVPTYQEILSVYDEMVDAAAAANSTLVSAYDITGCSKLEPTGRYGYIATASGTVDTSTVVSVTANWAYYVVSCDEGDVFTLNGTGGGTPRLWCFIDSSGTILSNSAASATAVDLVIIAPENASTLVINDVSEVGTFFKGTTVPHRITEIHDTFDETLSWHDMKGVFYQGTMNTSGGIVSGVGYRCVFRVEEGKKYSVSGRTFNMTPPAYCLWIFKNSSGTIIGYDTASESDTVYTDVVVTAPAGAETMIVNTYQASDAGAKVYGANDTYKYANKRILWLGTSIPEGNVSPANGYPNIIGDLLHCAMINNSVGASSARIGDPSLVTTANICGVKNINGLRNLTQTKDEKDTLVDNWETICGELGISYTPITDSERAAYKNMSYQEKVAPYLTGVNTADLIVINHCYNDAYVNSPLTTQPPTPYDRLYFYGAINFLVKLIREANPEIKIAIFGHYQATFDEALTAVSQYWYLPYFKLWDRTGWAEKTINATSRVNSSGAWETITSTEMTIKNQWIYDTVHPKGVANNYIANISAAFIRDLLGE